ncbi:GNAT family N-acetyltransferase [Alkalibacterium thalassium]|uniref:Acetyltransferase (GNAT) domain-containing protein n=1 Tax=Alkalibacterium thalassium TaxID=426701 RepID=A0A1G9FQ29_9LACT|nr:GNAT family N-acetyltransferase [Alkalibacterium thalassium]SDK90504.1 Acetyltransferase (GNAT) domain-containing protein [Alkalibacterium thalassium]
MTEIRELTHEYFENAYQLNVYSFHFKETEDSKERLFNEHANGQVLGSFSDDRLTSVLIIFPFEVYYHGNVLKMGGIGNVTSYPEVRGKGSVRQLMEKALKEMKKQGRCCHICPRFPITSTVSLGMK